MALDWIRVCYSSSMRTIEGADPVPGVWFPAPPGARFAPGPHTFGSSIWRGRVPWDGIGEQQEIYDCTRRRTIDWRGREAPAPYTGLSSCAWPLPADRLAVPGVDEIFQTNEAGQALCCQSKNFVALTGGTAQGGTFIVGRNVAVLSGGSAEGSSTDWGPAHIVTGRGGLAAGGDAVELPGAWVHAFGGLLAGGTSHHGHGPILDATGGLAGGGTAADLPGAWVDAFGGLAAGGTAAELPGAWVDAFGGLAAGGDAVQGGGPILDASGGLAGGGTPDIMTGSWVDAFGGLLAGGTATMSGGGGGPPCSHTNTYTLTMSGTSPGAPNGNYALTYAAFEVWSGHHPVFTGYVANLDLTAGAIVLHIDNTGAGVGVTYSFSSFDCSTGGTGTYVSSYGGIFTWASTVTVTNP